MTRSITRAPSKRRTIAARDGWACAMCRRPLREYPGATNPLPADYPTLDHIIPRSWGGPDCVANLRLACPECNMARGTGGKPKVREWRGRGRRRG